MRFPLEYQVELHKGDPSPFALRAAHRPALAVGPPPEFGGNDTWWSPEHLLVAAVTSCFAATLAAEVERAGLHIGGLKIRGRGILARASEGVMFSSVSLAVEAHAVPEDVERVREAIDRAKASCFVARSLRCPVEVTADVKAS